MLRREIFTGTGGKVFLDGNVESYIKEISVKATGNFEDVELCGDYEDASVYTSYKVEGTMTVYKTSNNYDDEIMSTFETGVFPERTIVTSLKNQNTNVTSSYSISNVVFTECTPVEQKKGVIEYSIPFKCSMPKRLK